MSEGQKAPGGPDLSTGVALTEIADGMMLLGHVANDEVPRGSWSTTRCVARGTTPASCRSERSPEGEHEGAAAAVIGPLTASGVYRTTGDANEKPACDCRPDDDER